MVVAEEVAVLLLQPLAELVVVLYTVQAGVVLEGLLQLAILVKLVALVVSVGHILLAEEVRLVVALEPELLVDLEEME